ncbi:MAG: type I 3-dehydroquinate dehydratase [Candidatus Hydrogenedentota bacterium]
MRDFKIVGCIEADRPVFKAKLAKRYGADLVEVRVDLLKNYKNLKYILKNIKNKIKIGIILTVRSKIESGIQGKGLDDNLLVQLYNEGLEFADYVDIEISSIKVMESIIDRIRKEKKRLILSYHNFKCLPRNLNRVIEKMKKIKSDIKKIAVRPSNMTDIIKLVKILKSNRDMVIIAMGKEYEMTRVFFPLLGSKFVYCAIAKATAPGQLSLRSPVIALLKGDKNYV